MKKVLAIIVLGMLWFNNAAASCTTDIKGEWEYTNNETYVNYKFTNNGDKWIKITRVGLWTESKQTVIEKTVNIYVKPFGIASTRFYVGDLNLSVVKTGFRACMYEKPSESNLRKEFQKKKEKSWFKWWYILVGIGILLGIKAITEQAEKGQKKGVQSKSSERKSTTSNVSSSSDNFIENVWNGLLPLGETFWLYYVIINGAISFGAAFFAEMNDNNIFLIAALVSNIWAGVGTWNSSTNYQLQKIKAKQPHGWAYVAKVLIVLNFLTIAGQVILLFNL